MGNHVRNILNAIEKGGGSFNGLDVSKPNLEEVFLKITDETLQDVPGGEEGAK